MSREPIPFRPQRSASREMASSDDLVRFYERERRRERERLHRWMKLAAVAAVTAAALALAARLFGIF